MEIYTHNGVDSDGLDLWISRRGSKAENFHQKMHVAVGPFGIGAETAHYLQVILAYQYLINTGVNHCGDAVSSSYSVWLLNNLLAHKQCLNHSVASTYKKAKL